LKVSQCIQGSEKAALAKYSFSDAVDDPFDGGRGPAGSGTDFLNFFIYFGAGSFKADR
jgi:hypothetical protein